MRQRTALTVAMVLTTFVLLIAASVIGRLALTPTTSGVATAAPLASDEPTAQDLSPEREAEYQQQLATANARLEQANRQLEDAYRRLTPQASASASPSASPPSQGTGDPPAASPSPAPSPPEASSSPFPSPSASGAPQTPGRITADQAAAAARAYVGGGTVERVELEEEDGRLVYEVRFTNNSRVYVDAVSGAVVYARLEESRRDDSNSGSSSSGSGRDDNGSISASSGSGRDDDRSGRDDSSGSGRDDRSDRDDRSGRDD
ncbi:MAG TPA: PepSY domain-containing protein [Herpetosiphonaceae bacterium]